MHHVRNTTITNNKALYGNGGGFYNLAIYNIVLTNIHNNSAKENGASNLGAWKNHVEFVKQKIKTNKILIKKIEKYFNYDEE